MFDLLKYSIALESDYSNNDPDDKYSWFTYRHERIFKKSTYYKRIQRIAKQIIFFEYNTKKLKMFDISPDHNMSVNFDGVDVFYLEINLKKGSDEKTIKKEIQKCSNFIDLAALKEKFDPMLRQIHPDCHIKIRYPGGNLVTRFNQLTVFIYFDINWIKKRLEGKIKPNKAPDNDFIEAAKLVKDSYKVIYNSLPNNFKEVVSFFSASEVEYVYDKPRIEVFEIDVWYLDGEGLDCTHYERDFKINEFMKIINNRISQINKDLKCEYYGDEQITFIISEK